MLSTVNEIRGKDFELSSLPAQIDLLLAYTPDAVLRFGSAAAIESHIRRIVRYANQAHENSGTGISFSVSHIEALSTEAADNYSRDLLAASEADGVWDDLLTLRETYRADMVAVLVGGTQGGTLCGLGYLNGLSGSFASSAPFMFSVVSVAPSCPYSTLAHELGHNLGSAHDRANTSGPASQPFSFGYEFRGRSRNLWHTVMAVTQSREVPFFSNPLLQYDRVALGVVDREDNARSLGLSAATVASYYETLGGPNLAAPVPADPDRIRVTTRRRRGTIEVSFKLFDSAGPVPFAAMEAYYSRGRRGKTVLRAFGRTNARGVFPISESAAVRAGFFYKACFLGGTVTPVCSRPLELGRVK
jgi:hypothetical protein